jgi:hypothetical protein
MVAIPFAHICRMMNRLLLTKPFPKMLELLHGDAEAEVVLVCVRLSSWSGETQRWIVRFRDGTGTTWWLEGKYRGLSVAPHREGRINVHELSADDLSELGASLKATGFWNLPQRSKTSGAIDADSVAVFCADRSRRHRVNAEDTGAGPLSALLGVLHRIT